MFVNTQEYVPGAFTTKEEVVVLVQTAEVLVDVNADKVSVGVLQVNTPLKGLTVYVGALVKGAIETMVVFWQPKVSTTVTV